MPSAADSTLAKVHFIITTATIWVLVPGISMGIIGQGETLAKIASMALFLYIVIRNRQPAVA